MRHGNQIYGKSLKDNEGNKIYVYTFINSGNIVTEIYKGDIVVKINYKGLCQEDWEKGNYVEPIEAHIDKVNGQLKANKSNEIIDTKEYMGCLVHQLLNNTRG